MKKTLVVKDIVGPYCGTYQDGVKLYREIYSLLIDGQDVELDFQGIQLTSSSFFSGAIINLLPEFADDDGKPRVKFYNLAPRDRFVLHHTLKATEQRDEAVV